MAADDDKEDNPEYAALYAIFKRFLENYGNMENRWDLLEEMMALRAEFVFNHALEGMGLDFEAALELLRNHNDGLSRMDKERRDILVAALDNLVDFAVAEEFHMAEALPDDIEDEEECDRVFRRYNGIYARVENDDIRFAMLIASKWVKYSDSTVLVYMTQGDERVRPWHMALEGTAYPKADFPAWLIPPIENGCRCFLVEDKGAEDRSEAGDVLAAADLERPGFFNPVFEESVCKGGRIFGPAHPYFSIPKKYKKRLREIAARIKERCQEYR